MLVSLFLLIRNQGKMRVLVAERTITYYKL